MPANLNVTMHHAITPCRSCLLVALTALMLAACAGKPRQVVEPRATISNNTGKSIAAVQYKACGSRGGWTPLPQSVIPPGGVKSYAMPEDCVDLMALHGDGKVAGTQRDIKREFPFNWVLY